jgi:site-specific DNA-methyltransferase (adenine-specific)
MTPLLGAIHGMDALDLLHSLDAQSADAIITDLPYGTTACAWDSIIPFVPLWEAVKHALKPGGTFVTTASQPFTSALVMSNPSWFRHERIWRKGRAANYMNAKREPLKRHESILVFAAASFTYNPQMHEGKAYVHHGRGSAGGVIRDKSLAGYAIVNEGTRHPDSVLDFTSVAEPVHPTQKPVALYEYPIRTYTQVADLVVDMCCGSGTTAIAARNTGRHFIVGDNSAEYVDLTRRRLAEPFTPPMLALFAQETTK